MMKKMMQCGLSACLVLLTYRASAQLAAEEYHDKSVSYYGTIDSFTVNIRMTVYTGNLKDKPRVMEGKIWRIPGAYRAKYPTVEILDNGKDYINCFTSSKNIYVGASETISALPIPIADIPGLISQASRTEVQAGEQNVMITLYFPKGALYKKVIVTYGLPQYSIRKIEAYYSVPYSYGYFEAGATISRFDIELYDMNVRPVILGDFFESSQYYSVENKKMTGSAAYSSFKIVKTTK